MRKKLTTRKQIQKLRDKKSFREFVGILGTKGDMLKSLLEEKKKDIEREEAKVRRYERFAGILPAKGKATKALLKERRKERKGEDVLREKRARKRRSHRK